GGGVRPGGDVPRLAAGDRRSQPAHVRPRDVARRAAPRVDTSRAGRSAPGGRAHGRGGRAGRLVAALEGRRHRPHGRPPGRLLTPNAPGYRADVRVVVVGGDGRAHALAHVLGRSTDDVVVSGGNAGT